MVDLTKEMADLMSALGRPQGPGGRALMFVSAYTGEGVSTVAREYARCEAAFAKKPVWLVDADLRTQGQMIALGQDQRRFGPPGPVNKASPDGSAFFRIRPRARDAHGNVIDDSAYLIARPFLDSRLWVTRFRQQNLAPRQRVRIDPETTYWQALRRHAQTIVVDVPAADRSAMAVQLAPHMDGIILVVSEGAGDVQGRIALKGDLQQAGGRLVGIVYNRARQPDGAVRRPIGRAAAL